MLTSKLGNVKLKSEKLQVNLAERTAMDKKDILKKAQKEGNDERTERNQLAFSTMTLVFLYIVTAILVAIQSVRGRDIYDLEIILWSTSLFTQLGYYFITRKLPYLLGSTCSLLLLIASLYSYIF